MYIFLVFFTKKCDRQNWTTLTLFICIINLAANLWFNLELEQFQLRIFEKRLAKFAYG